MALNPALDVSQYAHTAWKIRDGFPKGAVNSIVQTADGYLWLGTEFGLFRYDGVKSVAWEPPEGEHLPSRDIRSLLAGRDGTLWIGTFEGLASWKSGTLTRYAELAGQVISILLEDREGSIWAGGLRTPTGRLCAIQKGGLQCYGDDGSLGMGVFGLYEDRKGNLWAGVVNGLWHWKPGPPKFYPIPGEPNGIQGIGEGSDGALLISTLGGIRRFADGKVDAAYPFPTPMRQSQALKQLGDRDGGLWIGTLDRGLVHIHQGRMDVFGQSDGLSGDFVLALFEDRENNVWAATLSGLDRFRDFAVVTVSVNQGLSNAAVTSVLADPDGSIWIGSHDGLDNWDRGQVTAYHQRRSAARAIEQQTVSVSGLPDLGVQSVFEDARGRIWVSARNGAGYLENDRFTSVSGIPGGIVHSIAEDTSGNVWIANQEAGLFRVSPDRGVQQIPWDKLGRKDFALSLAPDRVRGGLWLGFSKGGLAYLENGQIRSSYTAADGLGEGMVASLWAAPDGTLWAATEGGLSRVKDGRAATLGSRNGLPCDRVHWAREDNDHSFWLYTACGLVRIMRPELDAWAADPKRTITPTVFDSSDGVKSLAIPSFYSPTAARSTDGKLWFLPVDGVSFIDPRHLPINKLPPPVHIEQVIADRKAYVPSADLRLPPLIRDLQIDYTALSLVAPERVRFRFKLEGYDTDWQDAGNRRQAFYTNLPPHHYRFRVAACNNSGVWNEAGASLGFSIDPAYYQSAWFQASCGAAFLALLGAIYQLRLRQVARQFDLQMEARVNERTRIARDLHDTLLQSFQGVLMKLSVVTDRIKDPPDAREQLETLVGQARQAVNEGREAVQGLRSSTVIANDLARAIGATGEEIIAGQTGQKCPEFRVHVEGDSRDIAPLVRDDVHRIACEAVRNAFRHSQAGRIDVEIHYERRQFRLRVLDNGKGIDRNILTEGGLPGHFGLAGMRERAELWGGKLAVLSRPDSGTEIELTIPAGFAYRKSNAPEWDSTHNDKI